MADAFRQLREVHQLIELLSAAQELDLSPGQRAACAGYLAELTPADGWSEARLQDFAAGTLPGEVARFLTSLRPRIARRSASA